MTGRAYGGRGASLPWRLLCPECRAPALVEDSTVYCPSEDRMWPVHDGIYPLISEARYLDHERFVRAYRVVRHREGWVGNAEYYLDLPFRDRTGKHEHVWRIRARSFRLALGEIRIHFGSERLQVLELGAGNCWFSSRLARLGHQVLATDIFLDEEDGLAAFDAYQNRIPVGVDRALADMEDLPLADDQFDLVVANGSLHYARDLRLPVAEAYRLLRGNGLFLVMDSPAYRAPDDGKAMVRRRVEAHRERFGICSKPDDTAGFLVLPDFVDLLERTGFTVRRKQTFDGWERTIRRWIAPLLGWTAPAQFVMFAAFKRDG